MRHGAPAERNEADHPWSTAAWDGPPTPISKPPPPMAPMLAAATANLDPHPHRIDVYEARRIKAILVRG